VIRQNAMSGTTAWQITGTSAPGRFIEGFASRTAVHTGQSVVLYVSTNAPRYVVWAFRMGYYGGKGARLVWRSPNLRGVHQPACPKRPGVNMVACDDWKPSLTVAITRAFVQGDYLFKLVGSQGQQSYVPLTVWDPSARAAYLIKNDVLTWQAWNPFGGYDFYTGLGSCPADHYPLCSRARIVSFDRPYAYGDGAGDFLGIEYPLIRFAEEHGLDVAYANDIVVAEHPSFVRHQRSILSLGHDECWSLAERRSVQEAAAHGVNVIFFGASAILRHVRLQASPLGVNREEVDYRNSARDPLDGHGNPLEVTGNTWSSPPTDWPESPFVGESYGGFLEPNAPPAPLVVVKANSWLFNGTGLRDGSVVPAVIASDFDELGPAGTFPPQVEVLAHSPIPTNDSQSDIAVGKVAYSDLVYYTNPKSGAGVLDVGTNNWIPALLPCARPKSCPAALLGQITGNIFRVFGQGPVGHRYRSIPNWRAYLPSS
jgi:hypothetical protein